MAEVEYIPNFLPQRPQELPRVSVRRIQDVVCEYFGVTVISMLSDRRLQRCVRARRIAYYFARELTPHSFPLLGRLFRKDHSTILVGAKAVTAEIEKDPEFAREIEMLKERIIKESGTGEW